MGEGVICVFVTGVVVRTDSSTKKYPLARGWRRRKENWHAKIDYFLL